MNRFVKINTLRNTITSVLIVSYIICSLILQQHLFNDLIKTNLLTFVLGFLILIDNLTYEKANFNSLKLNKAFLLALILILFVLLNSLLIRKYFISGAVFNIIVSAVIGKRIYNFKSPPWVLLIPFWFLVLYILNQLYKNINPEFVFINSRNYISFYLIITVLPYYFLEFVRNKNPSISPAFITVILSFFALGRSGIVASLLILMAILIKKFHKNLIKIVITGSLSFVIIFSLLNYFSFFDNVSALKKFDTINNFMKDQGRGSIIQLYLDKSDIVTFTFGMDTDESLKNVLSTYGHVHSSLLNFHSAVGLGSLFFLFFIIMQMNIFYKNNIPLLLLFLSILLRSSTDVGLLFAYFDYVIWMFLFFSIKNNKKTSGEIINI